MTTKVASPEMSVSETCARLAMPRALVYELIYLGLLSATKAGAQYRIDPASVAALQRLRRRQAEPAGRDA